MLKSNESSHLTVEQSPRQPKKWKGWWLTLVFALALLALLYWQLLGGERWDWEALSNAFYENLSLKKLPLLLLVLFLMPLNWCLETGKWLLLMRPIETISYRRALKAVLAGLTFSLFTPNRIGEYSGRVLMVSKGKRLQSVFSIFVGIGSQWLVLLLGGWWSLMLAFYWAILPIQASWFYALLALGSVGTLFALYLYYNTNKFFAKARQWAWWKKKTAAQEVQPLHYSKRLLNLTLAYSIVRYTLYSFQYWLLLYSFGFDANFGATFLGILIIYLLQTGIPLPLSTGLIARGNIALLVLGYIQTSSTAAATILAATFSLWAINVLVPAILGAIFMVQWGWDQQLETDSPFLNKQLAIWHPLRLIRKPKQTRA